MNKRMFFGTDGIRGRVGKKPMTPELILSLGYSIGKILAHEKRKRVVIGKDTRLSGYLFESVLEAGLSAAGVDITLLGPMPTPAIAFLTQQLNADAGIVISASHNPYYDNGIKIFDRDGYKLSDALELEIEKFMNEPLTICGANQLGKAQRYPAAVELYKNYCRNALHINLEKQYKCVIDCAHGATYHIAPDLFSDIGLNVIPINTTPDGLNINRECGSTHMQNLQDTVIKENADFGIAFDGDGDRALFVDEKGKVLDGDDILFVLTNDALMTNTLTGGVVGTEMTNLGLEKYLISKDIPFKRAKVGDRYVLEQLKTLGWQLGGESSGHIINLDLGTTGDGIMTALQMIAAINNSDKPLSELVSDFQRTPQILLNIPIPEKLKPTVLEHPFLLSTIQSVKEQLSNGRVSVRLSGTESILRIMLEDSDADLIGRLENELEEVINYNCIKSDASLLV